MPLVRIDLRQGKSAEYHKMLGEVVYESLVNMLDAPKGDRFQVISEHLDDGLIFEPDYLGIHKSADCVFIQVTLNEGRTLEKKRAFYAAVADGLHLRVNLRREDLLINLVEVRKENWSYGNGEAQYT
jgi:4-oxalocrotonate tautomerase